MEVSLSGLEPLLSSEFNKQDLTGNFLVTVALHLLHDKNSLNLYTPWHLIFKKSP